MFYCLSTLRRLRLLSSLWALSACAGLPASAEPAIGKLQAAWQELDDGRVFVVAHRGCWAAAPENSAKAVEACIALGVEAVEIDVQMTRDGELIVFHDTTLKRMTPGWGYVGDKTLSDLRALRLYERDGAPSQQFGRPLVTNIPISTLQEVFEISRGHIMINLEIKTNHRHGFQETFTAAVDLARQMGVEDHVFWKIPPVTRGEAPADMRANAPLKALETTGLTHIMPIVWQAERGFAEQIADFDDNGIRTFEIVTTDLAYWPIGPGGRIIGSERHRYMIVGVLPRWAGGLSDEGAVADPETVWGRMLELGADLIMTDRPEDLISYLKEKGLR